MKRLILAVALVAAAATAASASADPFDRSRDLVIAERNDEALQVIDSGQFPVNQVSSEGSTLLHYAASAGNLPMVKELLARGADPTIKSKYGATAFDYASGTMVKAELARAMSEWKARAANPLGQHSSAAVATKGANGMCAAVRAENINDGRSLQMRPWLRARDDIWYSHPDELALLLEDCLDANQQDDYGRTLLMIAAERDKVAEAKVLLEHGASCKPANSDGETALLLAHSPEMKAALANCPAGRRTPVTATGKRSTECQQKYQADAALCSDTTCKLSAQRKWGQCLKTGHYW